MLLEGEGLLAQPVELVLAARLRRDLPPSSSVRMAAVGLVHPVEALAEAAAEIDAVALVLVLEPGAAQTA